VDTLEEEEKEAEQFIGTLPDRARSIWYRAVAVKWYLNAF